MPDLDELLQARLRAAGVDLRALFGPDLGPWQAWLLLREHFGRRATVVDLYELEAASRGMRPDELSAADRAHLKAMSRPVRRVQAEVLAGSDRSGDPHAVYGYDSGWQEKFAIWRDRLSVVLGPAATRIDHVGSTAVPSLAAKPVIDIQVSVPDVADERSYLPKLESAGLILRVRETGHLFLWPPPARPREVHVHVCASGSSWERNHLLFRDYLRAHPAAAARYAAVKQDLIARWRDDRTAYGAAKTAFVLDTLEAADRWARLTGWNR
jgi:GrpB-like predicted nucleotidyltransferase (UPF0157 family)